MEALYSTEESPSRFSGVSKFVAETSEVRVGGEPQAVSVPGAMCMQHFKE